MGLVIGCMVLVIFIQGIIIGLPKMVDWGVKSRMPQLPAGFDPEFQVESIGPGHARITAIRMGTDVRADSLVIFFDWGRKRLFSVKKVQISGLSVTAGLDKGFQARVNGMALGQPAGHPSKSPAEIQAQIQDLLKDITPFVPGQIVLDHARLVLTHKDDSLALPFGVQASLSPDTGEIQALAKASVLGQPVEMTVKAGIENGLTAFTLDSRGISPACLSAKTIPDPFPISLAGPVDLHGELAKNGQWQFWLSNLGLKGAGPARVSIGTASGQFDPKTSCLSLVSDLRVLDLFTTPLPLDLTMSASLNPSEAFSLAITTSEVKALTLSPKIAASISPGIDRVHLLDPSMGLSMKGSREEQQLTLNVSGTKAVAVHDTPKVRVSVSEPRLSAKSRANFLSGSQLPDIYWNIEADKAVGRMAGTDLGSGKITASGQFRINGKTASISMSGVAETVSVNRGKQQGTAARAGWSGRIIVSQNQPMAFDLTPWVDKGAFCLPDEGLAAGDITFKTRITHPFVQGSSGQMSMGEIFFDNRLTARLTSRLTQLSTLTYGLSGTLESPDVTNKNMKISVKAGMDPSFWAECHGAIHHGLITDQSFGKLLPGIQVPGAMNLDTSADVWAAYGLGQFSSRAAIKIHGGSVNFPESNLAVQGVTGLLNIRDLVRMESYPGQLLTIDSISMGQFIFENASLRFRIQDRHSLGIENLKFNWCNGLVSSEATQLPPADGGAFRLILFCDRLEMAALLNQMGAFDARGGGTLSGRIPVTYSNGNLSFDNGFLFSTPGQGGTVAVRDLDRLMAGFPRGTPESSYLEMAGEALRDFQYNWATLKMNSQGDTLTVNMELDGKPSRILPFEFQKETNAFVRVDAKSPGANFQGIKLDLNLTLPFNEMAKFGTKIKGLTD